MFSYGSKFHSIEIPAHLNTSWKCYENRLFSDCWMCLFYLPGENVGSLSHTLHLDSLPRNPREEILNHSFLHAVFNSWVLETCSDAAAVLAEANKVKGFNGFSTGGQQRCCLILVIAENTYPKHSPLFLFCKLKKTHLAHFRKKEHNSIDTCSCIPDQTRYRDERL